MKAVVVEKPGGLDALHYTDVPDPAPKFGEIVIKVHSCGVCFHDVVTRNGTLKFGIKMPCILGHEVSGTVVELGQGVKRFRLGDRVATTQRAFVCGTCKFCRSGAESLCPERIFLGDYGLTGGYAEYVSLSENCVSHIPNEVGFEDASVAACAVGTLLNAVRDVGKIQMGETVLVTGAGGGLGLHAIQLARLSGAYVIAQTTSESKRALIEKMGAHEVVVHGRGEDFSPMVKEKTKGLGVDVIIDNVGTLLYDSMRKSLAVRGRWLMIGQLTGDFVPFNPAQFFLKSQSLLSVTSTSRQQLEDSLMLIARGQIKPVIQNRLWLRDVKEAHRLVESGQATGRILLTPTAS